jgi:hypothetical protein
MTLERITSALDKGGEPLGDLVGWELADANTPVHQLKDRWSQEDLDPALLPEAPTPRKALKVAAQRVNARLGDDLRVEVVDEGDEPTLSIQRRKVGFDQGRAHVDWLQTANIVLCKDMTLFASQPPSIDERGVQQSLTDEFQAFLTTYTTDDVRRCFVRTVQSWQAFSVFRGVYWIQPHHAGDVRKLARVIGGIGESVVKLIPITGSPEGQQTLQAAAQASLEQDLADLLKDMQRFVDKPPKSSDTLEARLDDFEALRNKAALYQTVLGAKVGDIETNLLAMTAIVSTLIHKL